MTEQEILADLLGNSPAFAEMKLRARQMLTRARAGARLPPVLIEGETGSGKGLLARALHRASPRKDGPFVAVNCGAIPETLGESEFFGFARGAHSEARQSKIGLFQAADRGTIFLDEVGLLSAGHQARLLKVVEDRQVVAVGATRPVSVDLWLISATNADLRADVEAHRFRRDLYERLAVITFVLPPLRERAEDIVPLAERFLARSCAEYGLRAKKLTPAAQRRLLEHSWPGNVRELSNVIERAALLVEGDDIAASGLELAPTPAAHIPSPARPSGKHDDRRERIRAALERNDGNITWTSRDLEVSRNTLRAWMRQLGMYPNPQGPSAPEGQAAEEDEPSAIEERDRHESARPLAEVSPSLPSPGGTVAPNPPHHDIHWERRWVTLLQLRLEPESDVVALDATGVLEIVAEKVQTFGGRVIELGRTGLEAAFGLDPLDDAAQRAAYAALAIERANERARERSDVRLVSRVGLHTGSFLVGQMGTSTQIDQDEKLAASTLLAALIDVAPSGGTMVSRVTVPFLRRRFDFAWPFAAGVAGEAHRLLGRAERPEFDTQASSFVGRDSELELIEGRFSLATQGIGQVVGIVGDPGVGKSRLVWEFLHREGRERGLVLETASFALGRPTPLLAIIELLRTCFGVDPGDPHGAVRDKVLRHVAELDPLLAGSLPAFLALLDVPTEDPAWDALDPSRRRQRTFDAIKRLMLRESARQPLILVFEDAHWADSETKALLDAVADSLPVTRVLMLVTFRPEYEHGWGQRTFFTQIRVDPLRGEDIQRFLRELLGEHPSLESLRGRLIEWTGGNPFFLEETVRALAEAKTLEGERGAYRLVDPVRSITVPDTVHEVLATRMARLVSPAHEVLQSAAVVGRRVPQEVLAAISACSPEVLDQTLELLRAREFLSDSGLAEEREYSFRHALTQEVAYASVPEVQRRRLHSRILDAIERVYASRLDDKLAELAHHALEGQRWEEAVAYLHRAGTRALAQSANTEAASRFEQALDALSHLSDRRERQELAIDLRFSLRNALTPLGQVQRTLDHMREAERQAAQLGDNRRQARALSFAANCLVIMAEYQGAIDASQQAQAHAQSLGDFSLGVAAGMYLGRAHAGLGDYHHASAVLREVVASLVGERERDYLGLPVLPAVFARSHLVLSLAELGQFDEAERLIGEAIAIAEATRHPDTLLWAYASAGVARLVHGQVGAATSALERAREIYLAADIPVYFPLVNSPLGLAYAMGGRVAEGLTLVEQSAEQTERRRQHALLPWTLLRVGEARLLADRPSEARTAASRALDLFRGNRERGGEAYALRLSGDIERRLETFDRAHQLLSDAMAIASDLGMRPLAARCELSLATLVARP